MDTRIRDTLVLSAMNQAIGREHPQEGLLVHTGRGAQYTSQRFQALLMQYGFRQSMSRKGNPYDNAVMESFYRTLKRELVQDAGYDNPEQARQDIFKYIELYYNTKRLHSAIKASVSRCGIRLTYYYGLTGIGRPENINCQVQVHQVQHQVQHQLNKIR